MCVKSQPCAGSVLSLSQIMKTYGVFALALRLQTLESCRNTLKTADRKSALCDQDFMEILASVLAGFKSTCEEFGADSSLIVSIDTFAQELARRTADTRPSVLLAQIKVILDGFQDNLSKRHFMLLSEEEAAFHSNPNLFGESFKEKYSLYALREAFDAGNCYAASLYTACVFHCMRVAEYGLRKLAANRILRVKLTKKGHRCPIEYGTWQEVIDAIRSKVAKIRRRPVGPKREVELQFLSNAADHCDYMKEIWRNELAHTRRAYKKEEALSVLNRVKEFVVAVGEHRGSSPAEDSIMRLLEQARKEEQLAASVPNPALPAPI